MFRIYITIIVSAFLFAGCWNSTAENSNAPQNTENVNSVNQNTNTEKVEDEKVPTFDDAAKALAKGIEYLDTNKIANAVNALKQAIELDPDLADAHFQLGVALSLQESEEEQKVPDEEEGEVTKDSKKKKSKKVEKMPSEIAFENAIKAYKKIIAKDGKDHAAHFNIGRAYSKIFDDQNAKKFLEKAVKLNDEDTLYRTELGAVLIKLAQYPAAISQLSKAIDLDEANYRAEDLLEKAQAGKKRVDHGQKEQARTSSGPASSNSETDRSSKTDSKTPAKSDDKPEKTSSPEKKPTKAKDSKN